MPIYTRTANVFRDLINFASYQSTTYVSVEEDGYFELGTVENPMNLEATVYIKFRVTNVPFSLIEIILNYNFAETTSLSSILSP